MLQNASWVFLRFHVELLTLALPIGPDRDGRQLGKSSVVNQFGCAVAIADRLLALGRGLFVADAGAALPPQPANITGVRTIAKAEIAALPALVLRECKTVRGIVTAASFITD